MDISFNILDCFHDSIDNIDITKDYIYVLELVEDRYYVGRSSNILRRVEEHFTNIGALYTMKYKPLKVIEIVEEKTREDERNKTLEIMEKYGWEKVRGAGWCSLNIREPSCLKKYAKMKKEISWNEEDLKMKDLYILENRNVIEIGDILKRSPCQIAWRLAKLGIIIRKQLARGYFEYFESDAYKKNKERYREKRNKICLRGRPKKVVTENKEDRPIDLKNIKNIIREKYLMSC